MKGKIADLPPEQQEQQRLKWREAQQKTRDTKKAAQYTSTADEWTEEFSASEEFERLNSCSKKFALAVAQELGREVIDERFPLGYCAPESEEVEKFAWILHSFKKDLIRQVEHPSGELFGGMCFADIVGFDLIKATQQFSLMKSATYAEAYRELLGLLDERYCGNRDENSIAVWMALRYLENSGGLKEKES